MTLRQAGVGERIRQARKDKGWKQKHLAAEVHVEPVTVSRWERGVSTPDLETIEVIASVTGKTLGYFVQDPTETTLDSGTLQRFEAAVSVFEKGVSRLEAVADRMEQELPVGSGSRRSGR